MMAKAQATAEFVYICLLRGINVSGQKIIKMEKLRETFATLGFEKISTYVQSGNVVFESKVAAGKKLAEKINSAIKKEFGFDVPVVVISAGELRKTIKANPFLKEKGIDVSKLHCTFLSDVPPKAMFKGLEKYVSGREKFKPGHQEIYIYCPNGYGTTKLNNTNIERVLKLSATTRNWNTVMKLDSLSEKLSQA
jgi:uncharacterized protein (DUF1697 family)